MRTGPISKGYIPASPRVLVAGHASDRPGAPDQNLFGQFAAIANAAGHRTAVVSSQGSRSYAQLHAQALAVAGELLARKLSIGECVGISAANSADRVAAVLGIMAAGGAYLPIDPSYPGKRMRQMLGTAAVRFVLGDDTTLELPSGVQRIMLAEALAHAAPAALPSLDAAALAYLPFTSGSTGTPKGVEITHGALIALARTGNFMQLDAHTRFLHAAPLGFDASSLELWGPLLNGGTVVLHDETVPTAAGLKRTVRTHRVTSAWLTAALFNAVVDDDVQALEGLRELAIGGEALSPAHVGRALAALPAVTLINGYGPTESTTFTTTWRIPHGLDPGRSIPIGVPLGGRTLHVVDEHLQPVPAGESGELLIGGCGLARGYLGQPGLTAEKFILHSGERVYRSGDQVRRGVDGVIEFLGRKDAQLKVRGFRIEPAEVEAALLRVAAVHSCAVIAREDAEGEKRLVAYYCAAVDPGEILLRDALAEQLPAFMLPQCFVRMDALPRTPNGKLDRAALPAPAATRPALRQAFEAPRNDAERQLCELFAQVLGLDRVGRLDGFFELGGDSLRAVRLIALWNRESAETLSAPAFFQQPTPAGIAAKATASAHGADPSSAPARAAEPIAIIGMAGRFPGANDIDGFWQNLCAGRDTVSHFSDGELDASIPASVRDDPNYVRARGLIADADLFDAAFFGISPREAELMDPQQRVFLELCWECLERGGYAADAQSRPVGIFAGMYNAWYFLRHVQHHPERIARVGDFQVMLANEKDYIATRVAHKLDLKGPAISVHTACSTSLVAIAQAFDSLRNGGCYMALAGGVSITCPPRSGYVFQEGSMLSPDGRTRSFDAAAQGTVFSDGAGVVLLKRLSDALADGDQVHAVIRGAAINNDGAVKASFTAPSSAQQAAVIRAALQVAGVAARSISYVETHGTATPLGDPIEIEGLRQAFAAGDSPSDPWCAIGSVKSNLGHLVIAAGVTGLIKTALSLRERKLPPSIHFERPNPALGLEGSPFQVNARLSDWEAPFPRRAGVSSFGVGGTNAHVILEEPPVAASDGRSASLRSTDGDASASLGFGGSGHGRAAPSLLTLSARTPAALAAMCAQLASHLEAHPELPLADVAHTLVVGRKAFPVRAAVVASDHAAAALALRAIDFTKQPGQARATGVAFLFPGQGAQYAGMGRELRAREPRFAAAFDQCIALASTELGQDLKAAIDDEHALGQTAITQPALFAVEYASAVWWRSLGVEPVALIGHSIGEYVAAALAGVMSLADAITLVVRRGALMQAQPRGSMLAVKLDAVSLRTRLPDGVSLAAENGPRACVASGPDELIEALRAGLEADGITCRCLATSHAFHSPMMDAAADAFRSEVEKITLNAPRIPIVSTLTGARLSATEATDPDYWARQLREPVRFLAAVQSLLGSNAPILLECGPRATLSALARQQRGADGVPSAIATLGDQPDCEHMAGLTAVGELWRRGVDVRRESLDPRARRMRVELPTYPFERQRHWVEAPVAAIEGKAVALEGKASGQGPDPRTAGAVALCGSGPCPDASPAHETLVTQLIELFDKSAGVEIRPAERAVSFVELGLDSLALTQVALQLTRHFKIKISFRQLMETWESIDALAQMLDTHMPQEQPPNVRMSPSAPALPPQEGRSAAPRLSLADPGATEATPAGVPMRVRTQIDALQLRLAQLALADSPANFDALLATVKSAAQELQQAQFSPVPAAAPRLEFDAGAPPVPGARLGRDPDGKPGWFVPNPAAPGKYLKLAR